MKKSTIHCVFGWLITLLFCLSAHAQTIENCTDGIDDGNLVDCQDPDCAECDRVITCAGPNTYYMPPIHVNLAQTSTSGSQDLVLSTKANTTTVAVRTTIRSSRPSSSPPPHRPFFP